MGLLKFILKILLFLIGAFIVTTLLKGGNLTKQYDKNVLLRNVNKE